MATRRPWGRRRWRRPRPPGPTETRGALRRRSEASSTEPTYGGGPSKLHLVESGGNGVALLDYDGDGLLDIYTVSAFDLDERNGRARIPHRNALYRNLGGMKFKNVAAEAGVDAAAWGYGVCAGDYDGDGRARPLRHQLRPELPVPEQGGRHVRGGRREGRRGRRRLEHRLRLPRRRRRRRPRPVRGPLRHRPLGGGRGPRHAS